jgi:hypothetical protein
LDEHQIRVLGRVADEIERYRAAEQSFAGPSLVSLLNRIWGLYTAAEVRDTDARLTFERLYYALSTEDDMLQPSMPAGHGSKDRLLRALNDLYAWAADIRGSSDIVER